MANNGTNGRKRENLTGTLEARVTKGGTKWLARWYVYLNGKRVRRSQLLSGMSKGQAQKWLADKARADGVTNADKLRERRYKELEQAEDERREFVQGLPALSLDKVWDVFAATKAGRKPRESTRRMYKCQYDVFCRWIETKDETHDFTHITEMRQVSIRTARAFSNHLLSKFTADTHNKYISLLSQIWTAIDGKEREDTEGRKTEGLHDDACAVVASGKAELPPARLAVNPWKEIGREEGVSHDRRTLTLQEISRVVTEADGEMRLLFAVGVFTGLRLADCALLEWSSIDFDQRVISVYPRKAMRQMADGRIKKKLVQPPLLAPLANLLETTPPSNRTGHVMPSIAKIYERDKSALTDRIQRLFRKCGIQTQTKEDGKRAQLDVGFHSLRHTFVTLCAQSGIPLAVVQSIVGHGNPKMTEHYLHISQETRNKAMASYAPELGQAFQTIDVLSECLPPVAVANKSPCDDKDDRFRSLCATWKMMDADERTRFTNWIADNQRKVMCK